MILSKNIFKKNIQIRTENTKLRATNRALEEKLKELENRYDKDKLVKRAERLAEDNVKILTRYRKATKEKLRLKEKIKKAREYIEKHYEDRSFDEIHNELLEILEINNAEENV